MGSATCYNLLLLGLRRVRIEEELPLLERPFRVARVDVLGDIHEDSVDAQQMLREELLAAFRARLPQGVAPPENLQEFLRSDASLGMITDLMSYILPLDTLAKAQLLAEARVNRRAELLLANLRQDTAFADAWKRPAALKRFPPPFSPN